MQLTLILSYVIEIETQVIEHKNIFALVLFPFETV